MNYYEIGGREIYKESGFLIEFLVKKYGKKKLIKLIIELEKVSNKEGFKKLFKRIYGFELNYDKINKLLK